jgi:hypothetical protein
LRLRGPAPRTYLRLNLRRRVTRRGFLRPDSEDIAAKAPIAGTMHFLTEGVGFFVPSLVLHLGLSSLVLESKALRKFSGPCISGETHIVARHPCLASQISPAECSCPMAILSHHSCAPRGLHMLHTLLLRHLQALGQSLHGCIAFLFFRTSAETCTRLGA